MDGLMLVGPDKVNDSSDNKTAVMAVATRAARRQLKMRRIGDIEPRDNAIKALDITGLAHLRPEDTSHIAERCSQIYDDFVRVWNQYDIDEHVAHSLTRQQGVDVQALFVRPHEQSKTYKALRAAMALDICEHLECF